jgi:pilus assembly protein CpaB
MSKIVLQNKRVLSTASEVETTNPGKPKIVRSITLEVTPAEAEKLSLASLEGKIILALRGKGDEAAVATRGSSAREVLAIAPPKVSNAPRSGSAYEVEMYVGGERTVLQF